MLCLLTKQKELGFEIFRDGELHLQNFLRNFTDVIEGFDLHAEFARGSQARVAKVQAREAHVRHVTGIVHAKLRHLRPLAADELPLLEQHSQGDIKVEPGCLK